MRMSRFSSLLMTGNFLVLAGCASGGGGGGGAGGLTDNMHTRTAELYLAQAASTGDMARYQQALEAATNSIIEDPENALGYFQAGKAHVGLADQVGADSMFTIAQGLYPDLEPEIRVERESAWIALFNSAIEPLDRGDTEEGLQLLEDAEVIFSMQRPEALINMGVSYTNIDRVEDAIDAYARALEVIRGPRMQEVDSATASDWSQRERNVTFNRAQLLGQQERYDEAAGEYEVYLESNPGDVQALIGLASVLSEGGMSDEAEVIYNDLLSASDIGIREYLNIGVGFYTSQAYGRAAEAFRQVVDVAPDNRDAVFNLAQSLYDAEEWEALIPVARRLVDLDGYNADSYTILAQALVNIGSDQDAVVLLNQREELPFRFEGGQLRPRAAGGGSFAGSVVNNTLEPGATVSVRVHFNGDDGAEVGVVDVRVVVPDQGNRAEFQADLTSGESVVGYYLEVVSPL